MLIRKFVLFIFNFSWLIVTLAACSQTVEPPAPVTLRVVTVPAASMPVSRAAKAFSAANPTVTVSVDEHATVRALNALWNGVADMAVVSAVLPGAEQFEQLPLTRDGIAIITHPDNGVAGVTLLELQRLFAGEIYRWGDIPNGAGDVTVAVRERDSGTRTIFDERVMAGQRLTPMARVFSDAEALRAFVADTPGAVGYISAALVDGSVKVLAVEDISPTPENIANGAYPVTYLLTILTLSDPSPELRAFIAELTR